MAVFVTLKRNVDFRRIYRRGRSAADPALVVYYCKNRAGFCRIGITVSKKTGNAVERNRAKRIIREAFRTLAPYVCEPCDFVFVARSRTKLLKSTDVERAMRAVFVREGLMLPEAEDIGAKE